MTLFQLFSLVLKTTTYHFLCATVILPMCALLLVMNFPALGVGAEEANTQGLFMGSSLILMSFAGLRQGRLPLSSLFLRQAGLSTEFLHILALSRKLLMSWFTGIAFFVWAYFLWDPHFLINNSSFLLLTFVGMIGVNGIIFLIESMSVDHKSFSTAGFFWVLIVSLPLFLMFDAYRLSPSVVNPSSPQILVILWTLFVGSSSLLGGWFLKDSRIDC